MPTRKISIYNVTKKYIHLPKSVSRPKHKNYCAHNLDYMYLAIPISELKFFLLCKHLHDIRFSNLMEFVFATTLHKVAIKQALSLICLFNSPNQCV